MSGRVTFDASAAAPLETEEAPESVRLGYPIYWFDVNRRIYAPRKEGEAYSHGGPIYRNHWRRVRVTGETARTWIVNYGATKFSKVITPGMPFEPGKGLAWTAADVDELAWCHDHRHILADKIRALDAPTLIRIARLLGYEPLPS